MTGRIPDPASPAEEEGIPGLDDALPGKQITGDPQEGLIPPGDRPLAVEDFGTTADEQLAGEPLDGRLAREQPDVGEAVDRPADDSLGSDLPYPADREELGGRLVAPDAGTGPDTEPDLVAFDVGTDTGGFSAEERAIRVEPEP